MYASSRIILLIDQKLRVGRLDGRYTGPDPSGLLDTQFYDPTGSATQPPFTSVFNNYVRTELDYKVDMPYYVRAQGIGFDKWDWGSAIQGFPDTASAMRQAIVKNPYLKVLVMEGYYDLATPYYAANYTVDHLNLPREIPGEYFVCDLRFRAHGVSADGRAEEDEGGSGGVHDEVDAVSYGSDRDSLRGCPYVAIAMWSYRICS